MTLQKALALGSTCAACGAGRKAKNLRYDPNTFLPYCDAPHICNEEHPNSPKNLIKRQAIMELFTADDIREAYQKHLLDSYVNTDSAMKIHRLMIKPTTIRILDPEMAEYLINLQEEKEFDSLAETMRYCVQIMMENNSMSLQEMREQENERVKAAIAAETVKELEEPEPEPEEEPQEEGWSF